MLSGKEFNKKYEHTTFVKLTNKDEIHNDFQYITGLNVDTIMFIIPFKISIVIKHIFIK